jgi:hypothetical protein
MSDANFWKHEFAEDVVDAAIAELEVERDALREALHRVWVGHKKWHCPTTDTEEEWMVAIGAEREGGEE